MTISNFKGRWSGIGESTIRAKIHMRIVQTPNGLKGYAVTKAVDNSGEIFEFEGKEDNPEKAQFDLVDYVSDDVGGNPPFNVQIVLTAKPDVKQIEGVFVTDKGTHGNARFRKARFWGRFQLSIPIVIHKLYRLIKKYVRMRFRVAYFACLVGLAILSIIGKLPSKFNPLEVLILLLPLVFLYSDKLRKLIAEMSVKKLGPVEFQEQPKPSPMFDITRIVNALSADFGGDLALFSTMTGFFVPNTKNLLRLLVSLNRPVNMTELNAMAKKIGVPDQNLDATLQALVGTGTVKFNDNKELGVQETGKRFLDFEAVLARISQQ